MDDLKTKCDKREFDIKHDIAVVVMDAVMSKNIRMWIILWIIFLGDRFCLEVAVKQHIMKLNVKLLGHIQSSYSLNIPLKSHVQGEIKFPSVMTRLAPTTFPFLSLSEKLSS